MSAAQPTAEPNSQTIESRRAAISESVIDRRRIDGPLPGDECRRCIHRRFRPDGEFPCCNHRTEKLQKVIVPRLVSLTLLLALAFHLFGTLLRTSTQAILQGNIRKALAQEIAKVPGARLAEVTLVPKQGKTTAWVVIRTPQPFTPDQVAHLNDLVNTIARRTIPVTVRSVLTAETTRYENVYEPEVLPNDGR